MAVSTPEEVSARTPSFHVKRPIKSHVSTKIGSDPAQRPASSAQHASSSHLPFFSSVSEGTLADDIGVDMPHWSLKMPWGNIHRLTSPLKTTPRGRAS